MQDALSLFTADLATPPIPSLEWKDFRSHIGHIEQHEDRKRIQRAFALGMEMHEGQKRYSGEPYYTHCIAVAQDLADAGADAETIIVALLHDTVEDTSLSLEKIEEEFGEKTAFIIDGVTKLKEGDLDHLPDRDERIETLRKIFTFMQKDIRIIIVKLYDRLHNMETASILPSNRQKALAEETLQVFVKVAGQLCIKQLRDRLELLSLRVLYPDLIESAIDLQVKRLNEEEKVIQHMQSMMQAETSLHIDLSFFPVPIRWSRLVSHIHKQGDISSIPLTVTISTPSIEDCYRVLYLLHRLWQREIPSFDDHINSPLTNGYQALHTTVILQDGRRVRCLIRTQRMDTYSRDGILTSCFTESGTDPLSWLASTMTVSRGLARSEEFWVSLQSDILGESILVHGPGDRVIMVPQGCTALDASFYFYKSAALRTKLIRVNGQEVFFSHVLAYGDSVEIEFAEHMTVRREWLDVVRTGVATTKIRAAISRLSRERKTAIGRQLLDEYMHQMGKGYLNEFSTKHVLSSLKQIGFSSMEDAAIAIAEGRFEPYEVYDALFGSSQKSSAEDVRNIHISFSITRDNFDALRRLVNVYQKFKENIRSVRMRPVFRDFSLVRISIVGAFSSGVLENLRNDVLHADAQHFVSTDKRQRFWSHVALPGLIILWGLDCFFADRLISAGVHPFDLTFVRFVMLTLVSAVWLAINLFSHRHLRMKWVLPVNRRLYLCGFALFVTAISSYVALQTLSAIGYATCMALSTIILTALYQWETLSLPQRIIAFCFAAGTLALIAVESGSIFSIGFWAGICAIAAFVLYSIASVRYQKKEAIRSRYPFFVFYFSSVSLLLAIPFVMLSGLPILSSPYLLPSVIFSFFLTTLPYLAYFALTVHVGARPTQRYIILFLCIVTLLELLLHPIRWLAVVPGVIAVLWVVFGGRREETEASER